MVKPAQVGGGDHAVYVVLNHPHGQAVALRAEWWRESLHVAWLGLR